MGVYELMAYLDDVTHDDVRGPDEDISTVSQCVHTVLTHFLQSCECVLSIIVLIDTNSSVGDENQNDNRWFDPGRDIMLISAL